MGWFKKYRTLIGIAVAAVLTIATAGFAAPLGAAILGAEAAAATILGTAVTVGEVAGGAVLGSGIGAVRAGISGENIARGALTGAVGGAVSPLAKGLVSAALGSALGPEAASSALGKGLSAGVGRLAGGVAGGVAGGKDISQAFQGALPGALASGIVGGLGYEGREGAGLSSALSTGLSSLMQPKSDATGAPRQAAPAISGLARTTPSTLGGAFAAAPIAGYTPSSTVFGSSEDKDKKPSDVWNVSSLRDLGSSAVV